MWMVRAGKGGDPITLVALPDLRDLLLEHCDRLDEEARALVPLRRVYLPFDPNG